MSKIIEGVPDSISREQYVTVINSLGLDPARLVTLEFHPDGICATVAATGDDGNAVPDHRGDEFAILVHKIFIPIDDDEVAA